MSKGKRQKVKGKREGEGKKREEEKAKLLLETSAHVAVFAIFLMLVAVFSGQTDLERRMHRAGA